MRGTLLTALAIVGAGVMAGCESPTLPEAAETEGPQMTSVSAACWGQATKVFAMMEDMGQHASEQTNPRAGLRNLAIDLWMKGIIAEPTLQALGAWVAAEEGYSIEACM